MAEKEEEKYEGSFGIIRKVRMKSTGQIVCRKEISYSRMSEKEKHQLHSELKILESLHHPNIVHYMHREHLKSSHDLHLYMEYCGNGDLSGYVTKLRQRNEYADEAFVWSIFAQLVNALYRCHYGDNPPAPGEEGKVKSGRNLPFQTKEGYRVILHRDLKPENVFLGENNSVKLGDFGLSKIIASHDFASTYVGTPFYMSPEICASERYSHHSDIWSLGCIIYELASRCVPFDARNHMELIFKIRAGKLKPLASHYSRDLTEAIHWCLKVDPRSRPDSAQLLNITNIKLARTRLQQIEERKASQPLHQERDAALLKLGQAQKQIQDLQTEVQRLREHAKKVEMEWHARATLAIDQRVHEQVEAKKAELLKQFESAVDQRAEEKLGLHLASLPDSHGLEGSECTNVRSSTPPPGKVINFATATTLVDTDVSSLLDGLEDSMLETDLDTLSLHEQHEETSPLARRTKPPRKGPRKPLGRAKTYANCNVDPMPAPSPVDIDMVDPSPMPPHMGPMTLKGLSLSPRKNGQDRLSGGTHLRRNIFQTQQNLRLAGPKEHQSHAEVPNDAQQKYGRFGLTEQDESHSRPSSGWSNASNADPFNTRGSHPSKPKYAPRPSLGRQKTMPAGGNPPAQAPRPTTFNRNQSPEKEKENRPPSAHAVPVVTASPTRKHAVQNDPKVLTPSRKAPLPPASPSNLSNARAVADNVANEAHKTKVLSPSKVQGKTLVQLQQTKSQPVLANDFDLEPNNVTSLGGHQVPKLLPSPAKWDPARDGEEMPSPFLAKRVHRVR